MQISDLYIEQTVAAGLSGGECLQFYLTKLTLRDKALRREVRAVQALSNRLYFTALLVIESMWSER